MTQNSGLTLVTRNECGLCEDLARDLSRLRLAFASVDVDAEPELLQRYDECVPVLLHGGNELVRAPYTRASLQNALKQAGVLP